MMQGFVRYCRMLWFDCLAFMRMAAFDLHAADMRALYGTLRTGSGRAHSALTEDALRLTPCAE